MVIETVVGVAALEPGLQLVLSLGSIVTMVTVLTACVCCKKPMKHREDDLEEAYGVIPADDPTSPRVNFRFGNGHAPSERHSQPASKTPSSVPFGPRTSAPIHHHPPRALPPIPREEGAEDGVSALYAQIDKRAKSVARDDIEYADGTDGPTGTYDTIDYEDDIDQLYSRVGPQAARRYDYPQFKRVTPPTVGTGGPAGDAARKELGQRPPADPTYQSASQIYGPPGSEDPYSSIASGPRTSARQASADGGGDSSSAYDPGYARVRLGNREGRVSDDVDSEVDQLYSKIRRSASPERVWEGGDDASQPTTASMFGLPGSRVGSTLGGGAGGERARDEYAAVPPAFGRAPLVPPGPAANDNNNATDDDQSMSSRDPSYRYITVRESAETIRARLEREQRIPPAGGAPGAPVREHYYSTIGSDRGLYESVDEQRPAPGARQQQNQQQQQLLQLAVDTNGSSPSQGGSRPPLPPTSPIPDRNALQAARGGPGGLSPGNRTGGPPSSASPSQQLYSAINKQPARPVPGAGTGASKSPSPAGNGSAPARTGEQQPARNDTSTPTTAAAGARGRSPFGGPRHATIVKPEDDGFEDAPKVVRRPPLPPPQRTPSEERGTVGDGPGRKEAEERSTVARYDVDLRRREQSPGRLQRDSSEDRGTQTVQRPTVVSPGIPLMNGSLPPSMTSSSTINNATTGYGIDSSSRSIADPMTSSRSIIADPTMTSSLVSETGLPEEVLTRSVTTTETTSTDPDGVVRRRVVEERETICERRSACSSRSSSASVGGQYGGMSEDEMECGEDRGAFSARGPPRARIRHDSGGSQSARYASSHSSLDHRQHRVHVGGAPGPEFTHGGDRIYRVPIHLSDSTQSLETSASKVETRPSRASGLPRRQSSEELRVAHARSRERRDASAAASRGSLNVLGAVTPRSSSRARREEEDRRKKESSIYTGRDYVSPIDLTTERGWPLVGQSSPPSLRREMMAGQQQQDDELTPRAPMQPTSGRGGPAGARPAGQTGLSGQDRVNNNNNNNGTPRKQQPPPITNGIFVCDLSSSEESLVARRAKFGGASGAEADAASHASHCPATRRDASRAAGGDADAEFACYCHTPGAQRADVWRSNHKEMHTIGYGRVLEDEIC